MLNLKLTVSADLNPWLDFYNSQLLIISTLVPAIAKGFLKFSLIPRYILKRPQNNRQKIFENHYVTQAGSLSAQYLNEISIMHRLVCFWMVFYKLFGRLGYMYHAVRW